MTTRSFRGQVRPAAKLGKKRNLRLQLEVLEDRVVPATRIWDGNALSNNWSNAFNWAQDIAPSHGDDLVFPAGSFNDNKVADNDYAGTFNARSITFLGSGFTVRGNPINLGVGGIVDTSGSSNRITNDVNLTGSRTFNIGSGSTLFMDGEITGGSVSTLTKTGAGSLSFEAQNSYFGHTLVNQGRLFAKKDNSLGSSSSGTTVKAGATLLIIDSLLTIINNPESLTIEGGGILRTLGDVKLSGNLFFHHDSTFRSEGSTTITAPVSFSTTGTVVPNLNSDFEPSVLVEAYHNLEFQSTVILNGGIVEFSEGTTIDANVTFQNSISGPGGLQINTGLTLAHATKFNGNTSNTFQGGIRTGHDLTLNKSNGAIAVPGPLVIGSTSRVRLSGHQQISSAANVQLASQHSSLGYGLDLNGFDNTIATLNIKFAGTVRSTSLVRTGVLTVTNGITADVTGDGINNDLPTIACDLNLGTTNPTITVNQAYLGPIGNLQITGRIIGTQAGLVKAGVGTLILTGNNTYQGNTTVNAGNLRIHGNQAGSDVVVTGGRLLGTGTVGNLTVQAGGRVKPGSIGGFGILHVAGDVNFLAGSMLEVSLNNPIAGSGYDQIDVDGPGTSGLGSGVVHFNGTIVQPFVGLGNAIGDTFRIIDNDDSDLTTGETFASTTQASVPQGGVLVAPTGERFTVNYFGSVGNNDVVLTRTTAGALFPNRSVTPEINEGGFVTLTGKVSDPDRKDTFILHINWGDGSPVETKVYPPSFNGKQVTIRHRYRQDRDDPYQIDLSWHDQRGAGNSGTLLTKVNDVAPRLSTPGAVVRFQNQIMRQLIRVTEPGADQLKMTVDYGDGSSEQEVAIHPSTKTALLQHRYSQPGQFQVVVTVRDQNHVETSVSFNVTILSKSFGQPGLLSDLFFSLSK